MRQPTDATIKLSQAARSIFDRMTQHSSQSCNICKRVIEHGTIHTHAESIKEKLTIPKPVPVSERMPSGSTSSSDDEPTMRPSQPPAVALATVLKGLEDELKHLKIRLSEYQALYNCHDPALSKRKRKAVYELIERLLKTIDEKADQIYALYDVLEGQKQSGMEMNEDEVEITLQRIGLDVGRVNLRGGGLAMGEDDGDSEVAVSLSKNSGNEEDHGAKVGGKVLRETMGNRGVSGGVGKDAKKSRQVWDLDSEEEELPWEGFEITGETTGRSLGSRRRS